MNSFQRTMNAIMSVNRNHAFALLFLRVFAGAMMMMHGIAKVQNFSAIVDTFPDPIGIGGELSFIMITIVESLFSLLLIFGLFTRFAAFGLSFAMIVAAFFTSPEFSISTSELAILYCIIFLTFVICGAGRYSIDNIIMKRYENTGESYDTNK